MSAPAPFIPLNDLERLLIAVREGGATAQQAFEAALLDAPLYAATPKGEADGETIRLLRVETDGVRATALFTAPERVATAFPGADIVSRPGREMLDMVQGSPAVLNPGQAYGARWSLGALSALVGRPAPRERVPSRLTTPLDAPADLVASLRAAFGADPNVQAAWLALADYPNSLEKALYLDVRGDPDAIEVPPLMRAALGERQLALPFDVAVTAPSDRTGIGIPIVARG